MGVRITIAAKASINVPTIRSKILIISKIMILFSVIPRINSAILLGTCSIVIMLPKIVAIDISTITTAEVLQAP